MCLGPQSEITATKLRYSIQSHMNTMTANAGTGMSWGKSVDETA